MPIQELEIEETRDFPVLLEGGGRVMLRIPLDFRERFLTETTREKGCQFQLLGPHLRVTFWSERLTALVYFDLDEVVVWETGDPESRTITQAWKLDITKWADKLQVVETDDGHLIHGHARFFTTFGEEIEL